MFLFYFPLENIVLTRIKTGDKKCVVSFILTCHSFMKSAKKQLFDVLLTDNQAHFRKFRTLYYLSVPMPIAIKIGKKKTSIFQVLLLILLLLSAVLACPAYSKGHIHPWKAAYMLYYHFIYGSYILHIEDILETTCVNFTISHSVTFLL